MKLILPGIALLFLASCGPAPEPSLPEPGTSRGAIVGGTTDFADPEVFRLLQVYSNGQQGGCTGTLIGAKTVLTAAHCVDPVPAGATSVQIWVTNKTDASSPNQAELIRVVETRTAPGWDPTTSLDDDVALALLERSPSIAPKPWNRSSLAGFGGRAVRAVGYGTTGSAGTGAGIKRTVGLTFRQVTTTHFLIGDLSGKGVCHGDSGGPTFHTFGDGAERVVGVHSYTNNQDCTDGADIRVDVYSGFVDSWFQEKEAPTCAKDGKCLQGCVPVDQDCACAKDGACTAQCQDPSQDPDCPKDCARNGVCALESCPTPDEDCVSLGKACTSELQCKTRHCLNDPQHPAFYCTTSCSGAGCPGGMECPPGGGFCRYPQAPTASPGQGCVPGQTFCTQGTVCTGPSGGSTTCQQTCSVNADCPDRSTCENGQTGVRYCRSSARPPLFLSRARAEGKAASCAAAPSGLTLGALFIALRATCRRGRPPRRG